MNKRFLFPSLEGRRKCGCEIMPAGFCELLCCCRRRMSLDSDDGTERYLVPSNFALVLPGVYRSSFPYLKHLRFLKTLGLKTILTLAPQEYDDENTEFNEENGIRLINKGIHGNKEPFINIPVVGIREALTELLDVRNHPILVHCLKGKHRTGCLIGALRKMCGWRHCSIVAEYCIFAGSKQRLWDKEFFELFDTTRVPLRRNHLPKWFLELYQDSDIKTIKPRANPPLRQPRDRVVVEDSVNVSSNQADDDEN